jgi:hypothetical protein
MQKSRAKVSAGLASSFSRHCRVQTVKQGSKQEKLSYQMTKIDGEIK